MAYGIFSAFADRAATFGTDQEEGARSLRRARRLQKEADDLHRVSFDESVGDALLWAQRNAHEAEVAFWRGSLFAAPTRTAAKRCLREGGRGLEDALRQEAIHPDADPLPFGLERHGMMTWARQDALREDRRS